jgi:hypothetical protein
MRSFLALTCLIFGTLTGVKAADLPAIDAPPGNGAVVYWQAFTMLPTRSADEQTALDAANKAPAKPLPEEVRNLVGHYSAALATMHRATGAKTCDWELNYADGPALALPHIAKVRELARAAQLRARLRFESGESTGAVDDLVDTLKMARDAASSPTLVSMLVGVSIETPVIELLAEHLPQLDRASLDRLERRLAALPTTPSVADDLRVEKAAFDHWLKREFAAELAMGDDAKIGKKTIERLNQLRTTDGMSADEVKRGAASFETVGKLRAAINRLRQDYEKLAQLIDEKPSAERQKRLRQFDDAIKQSKPSPASDGWLAAQLVPATSKILDREASRDMRRQLLLTAIDVQRRGQEAIQATKLPVPGTIEYEATSGGFTLHYRITAGSPPVSLRVGAAGK